MALLMAQAVHKQFGGGSNQVAALRGVDIQVEAGEAVAITGPSGSGKSSLLYLLGGIETPTSGRVLLEGQDLARLDDDQRTLIRRRRLGFIFQAFNLLPALTVEENIAMPLLLDRVPRSEARRRADEMMQWVGIDHRRRHLPGELSGGEQQRAAIARAIAIRPAVLLADEPTGNLDTANGQNIVALLRRLVAERNTALVIVTHDAGVAGQSDRVVHIRDGKVQPTGDR